MPAEGVHHGLDVVKDLSRLDSLVHQHAHAVAHGPQAPGNAEGEGPVRLGPEAHVPEGAVDRVVRAVGERDFQLPGHVNLPADGEKVVRHRRRVRGRVKGLPLLHAGEGAAHDVPGVVPAAAPAEDAAGGSLLHNGGHLLRRQVVELHRLAGGELQSPDLVLLHGIRQEFQPLQGQPPGGQAQAEHVLRRVPLGIAAHAAGTALVVLPVNFALLEIPDFPGEGFNLLSVGLEPFLVHHHTPPFFKLSAQRRILITEVILPQGRARPQSPISGFHGRSSGSRSGKPLSASSLAKTPCPLTLRPLNVPS